MSSTNQTVGADSSDIVTFTKLFESYRAIFYRIAYRAFQFSQPLAEDCVQNAFLRCLPHWGGSCRKDNFQAYIARAIIRLSQDHYRNKKHEAIQSFVSIDVVDPRMEREITRLEASTDFRALLKSLPAKYRELFELAADYELTNAEYGQILGIPHNSVKSRFFHGSTRLKKLLG